MYPVVPIFANIVKSKETHMNVVLSLAKKYHISIRPGEPGVYNNIHI